MSAQIIPFAPSRRRAIRDANGNCRRCGAILEPRELHTKHDCDAERQILSTALRANGWTENDAELPADLRQLLRDHRND